MQEAQTWRALLGMITKDPKERQRIIEDLNITSITLNRWLSGESDPRPQNLRHLINILPQYREQFLDLLRDEKFGDFFSPELEDTTKEISPDFYARVFVTRASTTENLRFWSICNLILEQAISQLDPDNKGMSIWIAHCMPPSGPFNKVRSLREKVGLGTPPWPGNLEQMAMFLGAESLAGNVVTLCRPGIIQNLDEDSSVMPRVRAEFEKSTAIYPILYAGRIAGVFLVSSTQYNHFLPQSRTLLTQHFADLAALAFDPEDFYEPEQIALCVMPPPEQQKTFFARYQQLLRDTMVNGIRQNQPVNNVLADQLVWRRLEEELLDLPTPKKISML
ncbi:MAG: GAF domain-containing protein [Chloroflexi bacterium]|nr:GAF domain-containing protein [Chloroflexota bacterium]